MNDGLEQVQAAGTSATEEGGVAPTGCFPSAKKLSEVQTATRSNKSAGAEANVKTSKSAKRAEARKAAAPNLVKKRTTFGKPVVAKTRCFAQKPVAKIHSLNTTIPESNPLLKFPVLDGGVCSTSLETGIGLLSRLWRWIRSRQAARPNTRRLRVASTASLGEKRFVAVIQVDGLQFLVGGGATNVVLLAKLDATESFGDLLNKEKTASNFQPTLERAEALA